MCVSARDQSELLAMTQIWGLGQRPKAWIWSIEHLLEASQYHTRSQVLYTMEPNRPPAVHSKLQGKALVHGALFGVSLLGA